MREMKERKLAYRLDRIVGKRVLRGKKLLAVFLLAHFALLISCARMGNPDGGWFDDTPPYVVESSPADKSTGVTTRRIVINFNEYIKLEDAQNKVIVSPPQLEMPEIKATGKRIIVELKDSLKENTTYTIDFSDAISDNNEGNPMGNYTFTFSTGEQIDTLEVGGYVLNAENLEPIKGILVGLYDNLADSALRTEPMIRISRTDSRGHFAIKGVAPGTYRAYALQDADGDFLYNQKNEMLAFNHQTFEPSWKPDTRQDTLWADSLHIADIVRVPYTHFLPDDVTLLAFTAVQDSRYLLKTERKQPDRLDLYFTYGDSLPPAIRGLNFPSDSAFVIESNLSRDTVYYWLRDTMLVNQDTLQAEVQYMMTDSTDVLVSRTDTIEFLAKTPYEKRLKEQAKKAEDWLKEQEKKKKKGERYDSVMPREELKLKVTSGSSPDSRVVIESPTPLERIDTAGIHLFAKVDSLWYKMDYHFRQLPANIRQYELTARWEPGGEYSLEVDSAAIADIYGLGAPAMKQGIKIKSLDEFGTLTVRLSGIQDTGLVVVMLNAQDAVVRQQRATGGTASFLYVTPGKYYLRAYVDANGNGLWDTGDYHADRQAEAVYYYPEETECKAKWDVTRDWNLNARQRFAQKPERITKQKAEQQKKQKNRNLERARQLGKEYIKNNMN